MTHRRPPDVIISIGPNTDLTITTEGSIGISISEYRVTQNHTTKFTFKGEPESPRVIYADYVLSLARLLTLFTGSRVYVESLFFEVKTRKKLCKVEFLGENLGVTNAEQSSRHYATVDFQEIKSSFPAIVKEWFRKQQIYQAVLNLYFATLFVEALYAPQQFLLLAQALEVYHNSNPKFTSSLQARGQFRKRVREILKGLPTSEQDWVKQGLKHANQKTLAQRIDEILAAHSSDVRKFVSRPRRFADLIRYTRNYYTHFDLELKRKKKIAGDKNMLPTILKMRALLSICLFKDLGVTGRPIDRIIQRVKDIKLITP